MLAHGFPERLPRPALTSGHPLGARAGGARLPGPGLAWLSCADPEGAAVHVAVVDYIQRRRFDRVRIWRADASGVRQVATLEGSQAALAPGQAYVSRFGDAILAVDLATGESRRVTGHVRPTS